MKTFFLVLITTLLSLNLSAQQLPKVFLLGEHEQLFEGLTNKHETMLLTACGDDMDIAFEKWQAMLTSMEKYSEEIGYDLRGGKMWLNVFWSPNGKIKHIAYYLKPNSRNLDQEKLKLFLISFINNYTMPLAYNKDYAHYGSASFPIMSLAERESRVKKNTKKEDRPLVRENGGSNHPK